MDQQQKQLDQFINWLSAVEQSIASLEVVGESIDAIQQQLQQFQVIHLYWML